MKRKFIEFEEYKKSVKPNAEWSFGSVPPFPQISTPKALFAAWAGTLSPTSGTSIAMGTLEVCRPGENDPVLFNFNQQVFYSTGTISLLEIVETDKKILSHHWTKSIPDHIRSDAPEWVKSLVNGTVR